MINDDDSQMSPLPIFPEGGGLSVHRLSSQGSQMITKQISPS